LAAGDGVSIQARDASHQLNAAMAEMGGPEAYKQPSVLLIQRGDKPVDIPMEASDLSPRVRLALGAGAVMYES
jgi:hypothetical protein